MHMCFRLQASSAVMLFRGAIEGKFNIVQMSVLVVAECTPQNTNSGDWSQDGGGI